MFAHPLHCGKLAPKIMTDKEPKACQTAVNVIVSQGSMAPGSLVINSKGLQASKGRMHILVE
jgi:hypothetical protein